MVSKAEIIELKKYTMPKLNILAMDADIITGSVVVATDAIVVDFWD